MATERTSGKASSARQAKERRRRETGPEAILQWAAELNLRRGTLPWTARLAQALFPRMQSAPDFSPSGSARHYDGPSSPA